MAILLQGSGGIEVRNLQTALNYHLPNAMPPLVIDSKFGSKTGARVVQFQTLHKLRPDGVVGPVTHAALYSFVDLTHHLLSDNRDAKRLAVRANFLAVGDSPSGPSPFLFPPLPRLQLPFPSKLPPMPSILQPPRLELDPKLLLLARITKFELEAGQQTTFKKNLSTGDTDREVALIADLKGTVWSKPFGKLELSSGGGVIVEKRLKPTPDTETSVYVFAKAEIKDILKIGPLDLAKIEGEAQIAGKPGVKSPPDLSATITVGPEVEVLGGKVSFGPGGYLEYKTNGKDHTLTPGVKMTGTIHF